MTKHIRFAILNCTGQRDVAQFGSAPDLGSGGRRFKSCRPDQKNIINNIGVWPSGKATVSGSVIPWFESRLPCQRKTICKYKSFFYFPYSFIPAFFPKKQRYRSAKQTKTVFRNLSEPRKIFAQTLPFPGHTKKERKLLPLFFQSSFKELYSTGRSDTT